MLATLRAEVRPMVALAAPLVIAELGWIAMGVVDTMMVGRLPNSAVAIGAASLGGMVYFTCTIFGGVMLFGLDTLVSQAYGGGRLAECNRLLWNGVWLALGLSPLLVVVTLAVVAGLPSFGVDPRVAPLAASYARILAWSTVPLLLYFALRRYLQAVGSPRAVMFALVSANLVNLAGNELLIYGTLGFPALGTDGSAWATVIARWYMASVLAAAVIHTDRQRVFGLFLCPRSPDWVRLRRLVGLGLPAAVHTTLEIGVFGAATALISRLQPLSLAAHQIALNIASITFMVPLGISSAAAVRVGHAIGRSDPAGAARAGWTAIAMGAGFMSCAAMVLVAAPRYVASLYTANKAVLDASVPLLAIAAIFQLFDGLQIVSAGALRGAGETRTPMLANLICYWFVGLPAGYVLCFTLGHGAPGLWIGLCTGLILIGSFLLWVWKQRVDGLGPSRR